MDFIKKGWIIGGEKPYLIGTKCMNCEINYFPGKKVCPSCFQVCKENIKMGSRGRINNFTIVYNAPQGIDAPYILSFIDLEEGPRLFSHLVGVSIEDIHLQEGDEVELIAGKIGKSPDGEDIIAWKYKPIS